MPAYFDCLVSRVPIKMRAAINIYDIRIRKNLRRSFNKTMVLQRNKGHNGRVSKPGSIETRSVQAATMIDQSWSKLPTEPLPSVVSSRVDSIVFVDPASATSTQAGQLVMDLALNEQFLYKANGSTQLHMTRRPRVYVQDTVYDSNTLKVSNTSGEEQSSITLDGFSILTKSDGMNEVSVVPLQLINNAATFAATGNASVDNQVWYMEKTTTHGTDNTVTLRRL